MASRLEQGISTNTSQNHILSPAEQQVQKEQQQVQDQLEKETQLNREHIQRIFNAPFTEDTSESNNPDSEPSDTSQNTEESSHTDTQNKPEKFTLEKRAEAFYHEILAYTDTELEQLSPSKQWAIVYTLAHLTPEEVYRSPLEVFKHMERAQEYFPQEFKNPAPRKSSRAIESFEDIPDDQLENIMETLINSSEVPTSSEAIEVTKNVQKAEELHEQLFEIYMNSSEKNTSQHTLQLIKTAYMLFSTGDKALMYPEEYIALVDPLIKHLKN